MERFFRWIKQHLCIKRFYGTSENAVNTQIWIAVSVYVLVAIVRKRLGLKTRWELGEPATIRPLPLVVIPANAGMTTTEAGLLTTGAVNLEQILTLWRHSPGEVAQTTTARDPSGSARCASMPSKRTISVMRGSVMTLNAVDSASAMVASGAMTETAANV